MNIQEPVLLVDYQCKTGEGPMWHPDEKRVYWVDIPQGRLLRYEPSTGKHEICLETDPIGGYTIQEDGSLLLFMAKGAIKHYQNGTLTTVIEEIPEEANTRFNDVIADPCGRVFAGTMSTDDRPGRLYRIDTDGSYQVVSDEGYGTPNGMGFTPDRKKMYFNDSRHSVTYIFDYDEETGTLSNRQTFIERPIEDGRGDGMTVDAEGNLWIGKWDGGRIVVYSPTGEEIVDIPFPAKKVSCVTFGGPDYKTIYATTAMPSSKEEEGPGAGALFKIETDIQGVPEFRSKITI